jgi:hypothetical protein
MLASPLLGVRRISATRAIKNAKYLQKVAPHIIPADEPPEGFFSIIPYDQLAQLHKKPRPPLVGVNRQIAELLNAVSFPETGQFSAPLFNGTLYIVPIQFAIQSQNNNIVSVPEADIMTAVRFATLAAIPISAYVRPAVVALDPSGRGSALCRFSAGHGG